MTKTGLEKNWQIPYHFVIDNFMLSKVKSISTNKDLGKVVF